MQELSEGTRVRNTVTGETGTVVRAPYLVWVNGRQADVMNVRYDKPLRGYSPQRDEFAATHVVIGG